MDKKKLKVGDRVRVINYGALLWENDKYGNLITFDMNPELIGKEGVVSKVTKTQGVTEYAVDGIPQRHAWYDRGQLERLPSEDQVFLKWVYDRMQHVHGEEPNSDYMIKLKLIIDGN